MKKILAIIIFVFVSFNLYTQIDHTKAGETLLLNASIKNELGEPINLEVRFADLTNKAIIARSNDEGILKAVLKQGTTYYPVFKNYLEVGGLHPFETSKTGKYFETNKMFLIRKIQENSELHILSLFKTADSNITDEGMLFLAFFKEFYSLNKNLQFKMVISAPEMKFKDIKTKRTELVDNKKKTIKITISAQEQLQSFLESRARLLTEKLKELGIPAKIFNFEYITKTIPTKQTKTKKSTTTPVEPNAKIIIEKILKL